MLFLCVAWCYLCPSVMLLLFIWELKSECFFLCIVRKKVMCILIHTSGGLLKVKARITAFTSGRVAVIWAVQLRCGWKESSWGFKSSHLSISPSSCPVHFICLPLVLREPWDSPKCIQYMGTSVTALPSSPFLTWTFGVSQEFSRLLWMETTKNKSISFGEKKHNFLRDGGKIPSLSF